MIPNPTNGWYPRSDFIKAMTAIHNANGSLSFMSANLWRAKYITIRTDQRTGGFILADGNGVKLTHEEVVSMFPELA